MAASSTQFLCLYCGKATKRGRRGEHVVQDALGGARTLNDFPTNRVVCTGCNTGFLSVIDRELCSRSYFSFVASQQIDGHLWQVWDVDHSAGHVLVEARPAWADDHFLNALVQYPQITFERRGADVRGDDEEFQRFGLRDAGRVLFKAVRQAFRRWCKTGKGLIFEQIDSGFVEDGCRFPPRVFLRHTIAEIARDIHKDNYSIILRYTNEEDKRFALYSLEKMDEERKFDQWSRSGGSHRPAMGCNFNIAETLRALLKIGLNLLAAYCEKTPVDHVAFAQAVRIIRGDMQMRSAAMRLNGFVHAADIQCIRAGDSDHSFRLMHIDGEWQVYSSFFGGRIGTFVRLPGPNHEDWNCADIVAPIGSKDWSFNPSPILRPMSVRVAWQGSEDLAPSIGLQRTKSSIYVEKQPRKKPITSGHPV